MILALVLAAAVVAAGALWSRASHTQPLIDALHADDARTRDLDARVRALEARLDELTSAASTSDAGTQARVPLRDDRLEARLAVLEAELTELRRSAAADADQIDDPDLLLATVEASRTKFGPQNADARSARVALLERFLDRFPQDQRAAQCLEQLYAEQLTHAPADAVAALDRFRGRVAIAPWQFDAHYANALYFAGRFEESQHLYADLIQRADIPEHARWDTRFTMAYQQMQHGQLEDAQRAFEAIARDCEASPSPTTRQFLDGARTQLSEIERLKHR